MAVARKSPGAALVLSLVPGAGHLYAGRTGPGLGWLVSVFVAYKVSGGLGLLLHVVCAATAAQAAQAANRKEEEDLAARGESASEVARMLDEAVAHRAPAPGAEVPPPGPSDPPPRILRGAFPVPPERLLQALAEAMRDTGFLVLGVDERRLRVRSAVDHGGGRHTVVAAQVEPTPAGSRVRLFIDRPEGSAGGADVDDRALRSILDGTERVLHHGVLPGLEAPALPPGGTALRGDSEALTEDHFLEQLREAWESYDQGWLPEEEWLQRKQGLIRGVVLRNGTRKGDFMTACRPLVEAGVLVPDDLRALEASLGG